MTLYITQDLLVDQWRMKQLSNHGRADGLPLA